MDNREPLGSTRIFLPRVSSRRLEPSEVLPGLNARVVDFWQWAYSDVLENIQRAFFAEYLVAVALEVTDARRTGWLGFDLEYRGLKIEVKSSAFLQAWNQRELSAPGFGIGPKQQLDADGIAYDGDPRYVADLFVFCLFADKDAETANVLDSTRWEFYVVETPTLRERCHNRKRLSLKDLRAFCAPARHGEVKSIIDSFLPATPHFGRLGSPRP